MREFDIEYLRWLAASVSFHASEVQDKDALIMQLLQITVQETAIMPEQSSNSRARDDAGGKAVPTSEQSHPFREAWQETFKLSPRARAMLLPPGKMPEDLFEQYISAKLRDKVLKQYPPESTLPKFVPSLPPSWSQDLSTEQNQLNSRLTQIQQRFYETLRPIFRLFSFLEVYFETDPSVLPAQTPPEEWEAIFVDLASLLFSALARLYEYRRDVNYRQKGSAELASAMRPRGAPHDIQLSLYGEKEMDQLKHLNKMQKAINKFGTKRKNTFGRGRNRRPRGGSRGRGRGGRGRGGGRFSGNRGGKGGAGRGSPPNNQQN